MSLNTAPRTWVVGEVVTAAELNAEIRDSFIGIQAAADTFTPTLTAVTTSPTLGTGGTNAMRYWRTGKKLEFEINTVFGTAAAAAGSGIYSWASPFTLRYSATDSLVKGTAYLWDDSTGTIHFCSCRLFSASPPLIRVWTVGTGGALANNVPWTWAINDQIRIEARAELA